MSESELIKKLAQMYNTMFAGNLIPYLDKNINYISETYDQNIKGKLKVEKILMMANKNLRYNRYRSKTRSIALPYLSQANGRKPYVIFCKRISRVGIYSKVTIKVKNSMITEIHISRFYEPTEPDETVL